MFTLRSPLADFLMVLGCIASHPPFVTLTVSVFLRCPPRLQSPCYRRVLWCGIPSVSGHLLALAGAASGPPLVRFPRSRSRGHCCGLTRACQTCTPAFALASARHHRERARPFSLPLHSATCDHRLLLHPCRSHTTAHWSTRGQHQRLTSSQCYSDCCFCCNIAAITRSVAPAWSSHHT